jgi:beta-glucosidase
MTQPANQPQAAYRDPSLSIEERVADLLGSHDPGRKSRTIDYVERPLDLSFINTRHPARSCTFGAKNWPRHGPGRPNPARNPAAHGEDAIHGHSFWKGATIFPTQLALACSWNPSLLEQVAA